MEQQNSPCGDGELKSNCEGESETFFPSLKHSTAALIFLYSNFRFHVLLKQCERRRAKLSSDAQHSSLRLRTKSIKLFHLRVPLKASCFFPPFAPLLASAWRGWKHIFLIKQLFSRSQLRAKERISFRSSLFRELHFIVGGFFFGILRARIQRMLRINVY